MSSLKASNVDRLSSLPDSLITSILSLLPIKSAAQTSILSRRWRRHWTHVTTLSIDYRHFDSDPESCNEFAPTVDRILSKLTSRKLHRVDLQLRHPRGRYDLPCCCRLESWILTLCARNPAHFTVNFRPSNINYRDGDVYQLNVPSCLFQLQSLVTLEVVLKCEIDCTFPRTQPIVLPNLKKLVIKLSDKYGDLSYLVQSLFKSCPLLEELYLKLYFDRELLVDISAPKLKSLIVYLSGCMVEDSRILINAPKLEFLNISGSTAVYQFVKKPTALAVAEFNFWVEECEGVELVKIMQAISSVRSLIVPRRDLSLLFEISDADLPVFYQLEYLKLTSSSATDEECIWSEVPVNWLSKVSRIDVMDVEGGIDDHEMLQHILSHANELELLRIYSRNLHERPRYPMRMEQRFCKELFSFLNRMENPPRCHIEFHGLCVNASSKDFKDDVVTGQFR